MNVLIFDCETNGKPANYKAHPSDVDNWPRIIQIAWQIADSENVLDEYKALVLPDNWSIPKEEFWMLHNFSTQQNEVAGIKMPSILDLLIYQIKAREVSVIVSHNIAFDFPILAAEMIRYGKKADRQLDKVCTMEAGVDVCKIPFGKDHRPWKNAARGYKWPRLSELYQKLFNKEMEGQHDALSDVIACRESFFELLKLGVIKLPVAV